MNPTQTVDNDLQKAIDDITKTTNQDPVFADPVAAPSSVPEDDNGELAESVGPFPAPEPEPLPAPEPAPIPDTPIFSTPEEPVAEEAPTNLNVHEVKEAALRDLAPLIDKMNIPASRKFDLYQDIFQNLRDYTVIEPAYKAAKNITDENARGEALLALINSIDSI